LRLKKRHHAVGQHHPHVDVRINLEEIRYHGQNVQASEDDGCSENKLAFGRCIFPRCCTLRFSHFLQNAAACGDIRLSRFSERKLAGGAMQEPGFQVRL